MENEPRLLAVRIIRIIPTALACAVAGCSIAYFFVRSDPSYLPIVVMVPSVWFFLLARILKAVLPVTTVTPKEETTADSVPRPFVVAVVIFAFVMALGGYGAITFLLSAGTFFLLGLHVITPVALKIASVLAAISFAALLVMALMIFAWVARKYSNRLGGWLWKFLSLPQRLADCFPDFGQHHLR